MGYFSPSTSTIVGQEVRGGRVCPHIHRVIVTAEQAIRAEVEALFARMAVYAFGKSRRHAPKPRAFMGDRGDVARDISLARRKQMARRDMSIWHSR